MHKTKELHRVRLRQNHMATTFDLVISCERSRVQEADSVLTEAHRRVARLEDELSEFRPGTPVDRLNRAAPLEKVPVPASVLDLLEQSALVRDRTGGAFDCTVKSGPLSREISVRIGWDRARNLAWKITPDARVSFGAIGKGYALDHVRALIDRHGFTDYLLNAGGSSLVFSGFAAPGLPWSWAWSWKRDEQGRDLGLAFDHVTGARICIGVSGLHEKGEHILSPRDPASSPGADSCLSALVAHPSASLADALSTALFVSKGRFESEGMPLDSALPLATASIDPAGIPRWNGWFQKFWGGPATTLSGMLALAMVALGSVIFFPLQALAEEGVEQAVDLGEMGANQFTPYLISRNPLWALLPALAIVLVLVHLIKYRPARRTKSKGNLP